MTFFTTEKKFSKFDLEDIFLKGGIDHSEKAPFFRPTLTFETSLNY